MKKTQNKSALEIAMGIFGIAAEISTTLCLFIG